MHAISSAGAHRVSFFSSMSCCSRVWLVASSCLLTSFKLVICTRRCSMRSSACASARLRRLMSTSRCRFCTCHAYCGAKGRRQAGRRQEEAKHRLQGNNSACGAAEQRVNVVYLRGYCMATPVGNNYNAGSEKKVRHSRCA